MCWLSCCSWLILFCYQLLIMLPGNQYNPKYIPKRLRWKLPTIAEWLKSWAASAMSSVICLFISFINYLLPTSIIRPYNKSYNRRLNRRSRSWYRIRHVKRNNITCSVRLYMLCRSLGMRRRSRNTNYLFNMYWSNLSKASIYQAWRQRSKVRPTFMQLSYLAERINSGKWNSDSFLIGVDTLSSSCMKNEMSDFIGE